MTDTQMFRNWGLQGGLERTGETAERDAEAVRLRSQRLSYDEIARRLGFQHRSSAKRAVSRGLAAIPRDSAAELLAVENMCLDNIDRELEQIAGTRWALAQLGRVVVDPVTQVPLEDPGPRLKALELRLKSAERRSRLNGHDAPRQSVRWDIELINGQIAQLEADLAAARALPDRPKVLTGETLPPDEPDPSS